MLTIKQLRDLLEQFEDDAEVRFSPRESCGMGFPEWRECRVIRDIDGAIVIVELEDER